MDSAHNSVPTQKEATSVLVNQVMVWSLIKRHAEPQVTLYNLIQSGSITIQPDSIELALAFNFDYLGWKHQNVKLLRHVLLDVLSGLFICQIITTTKQCQHLTHNRLMQFAFFPLHAEHTPYLLFSTQHSIRKLPLDSSSNEYTDIVIGQKGIVGLDYDYYNNYVYWTDVRDEKICRAHIPSPGSDAGSPQH